MPGFPGSKGEKGTFTCPQPPAQNARHRPLLCACPCLPDSHPLSHLPPLQVPKAKWASQDWLGVQESLDPRGSKDSWAPRVPKGSRDSPELQATPWKVPKGTVAPRDSLDCQVRRGPSMGLRMGLGIDEV